MREVWAETRRRDPCRCCWRSRRRLTYVLRAFRWQYLLAPIGPTRFSTRSARRSSVLPPALLPARAGEVIRPICWPAARGLSATAAFATIILERLLDLLAVLMLFAGFVLFGAAGVVADPSAFTRVKFGGAVAGAVRSWSLSCSSRWPGIPNGSAVWRCASSGSAGAMARAVARFVETFAQGLAVMRPAGPARRGLCCRYRSGYRLPPESG